jgi:hypothetical protein
VLLSVAAFLLGCAHARVPSSARSARSAPPTAIDYTFGIDAQLNTIETRVCFKGMPPAELVSGVPGGEEFLRRAWIETSAGKRVLRLVGQRIVLSGVPKDACVGYAIDVGSAAKRTFGIDLERRGEALVTNVALFLWRPPHWESLRELSARVVLPQGMRASLPWPRRGDHYVLDQSALAFYAFAVFGRFEVEQIKGNGATIEVAVLDGLPARTRAYVVPWLELASRAAALPFGRFPRAQAQVVVIPSGPSRQPVRFGTMNRGGGASAAMLLPVNAELEPLLHDWVAVHEFCHLLHPFVDHDDAWFSEGMATYYQEVLRVRAGMEPAQEAWRRLYDGAQLGHFAEHGLVEESAGMFAKFSFKMVYWAGAAFALMADVELRRHSHGKLSLDDVLREIAERGVQPGPLRARDVVARMDEIAGAPIVSGLMKRWVEGPKLPDLAALYAALGLLPDADGMQTSAAAKDAWIRTAIMQGPAEKVAPMVSQRR